MILINFIGMLLSITCPSNADWLIFNIGSRSSNVNEFNRVNNRINLRAGYPNNRGTLKYADPVFHPDGTRVAIFVIKEGRDTEFDSDERSRMIPRLPSDWIPPE